MNTSDLKSFHYLENGEITFSEFDTIKSEKTLDRGFYYLNYIAYPKYKVEIKIQEIGELLSIYDFPDKKKIDDLLKGFFNPDVRAHIKSSGLLHKIGILMYGKEGTGKSSIVKHYCNKLISEYNAIVFYIDNPLYLSEIWQFVQKIRNVQKEPIIVIFEEIDGLLKEPKNEPVLKTILDGNNSIDNSVFFCTTNYIDNIPTALKDRQSRFKYSLNIEGIQNPGDIFIIMRNILPEAFSDDSIRISSENLKGSTIDEIKQYCLDKMMDISSHIKTRNKIGFK